MGVALATAAGASVDAWAECRGGGTAAASSSAGSHPGWGTFHRLYRLDGQLVAVSVLDIVPSGVSSVYCFYHPSEYRFLKLGEVTALDEIQLVAGACAATPCHRYWYAGLFIRDCPKMNYKSEFGPCELRCAVTGAWSPYKEVVGELDAAPFGPWLGRAGAGLSAPAAEAARRKIAEESAAEKRAGLVAGARGLGELLVRTGRRAELGVLREVPPAVRAQMMAGVRECVEHTGVGLLRRVVVLGE